MVEKMMQKMVSVAGGMKILIWLAVIFLMNVSVVSNTFGVTEVVDRIVAVVNDDIIRLMDLNLVAGNLEQEIRSKGYSPEKEQETLYTLRMEILNNLIDEKLADQEIKNSNIVVDEIEIDNAIEQVKAMNYYTDEQLRKALAASGINMSDYRIKIKDQILRNKLVNVKIKSNIIITDTDIKNYYDSHLENYTSKNKYVLRNILMMYPPSIDDLSRQKVYQRMEAVYEQLVDGASFEKTAKVYSEAINANDGGRLGSYQLEDLSDEIKNAVSNRAPGEFSSIVETEQGFQLFFVEKIVKAGGRSLSEASDEIRQMLYEASVNTKFNDWVKQLREDAHIQIIR